MAEYLIATTHRLLLLSKSHRFSVVHSGRGLYFGLGSRDGRIYVGCQDQPVRSYDRDEEGRQSGSILVFEEDSLDLIGELKPKFPLRDLHGLACFDEKLWVTCCFDNLVAVYDFKTLEWSKWYPSKDLHARDRDVNHYNTIELVDEQRICVLSNNGHNSELNFYDRQSLELISVLALGYQAHDVYRHDGNLAVCSSGEGALVDSAGWTLRTGGFPRGIAFGAESILLGISAVGPRADRASCSVVLRRFDRKWQTAVEYLLPKAGMALAILPMDPRSGAYEHLPPWPSAETLPNADNDFNPNNVYKLGEGARKWLHLSEWHEAEGAWRWTAAREAGLEIIVNPGDTSIVVTAANYAQGAAQADVLLNGESLGQIVWATPGIIRTTLAIAPGTVGRCELYFRIPSLFRPLDVIESSTDHRQLGICVESVEIF